MRLNKYLLPLLFVFLSLSMSGCELVGDILEFGFWTAIIIIVLVVLVIVGIIRALRR
jgi:hypothetical protein